MADFEMQVKFVRKSGLSKKNQGVSSALRARTKGLLDYCNQLLTMAANVQWPEGCVSCHLLPPLSLSRECGPTRKGRPAGESSVSAGDREPIHLTLLRGSLRARVLGQEFLRVGMFKFGNLLEL